MKNGEDVGVESKRATSAQRRRKLTMKSEFSTAVVLTISEAPAFERSYVANQEAVHKTRIEVYTRAGLSIPTSSHGPLLEALKDIYNIVDNAPVGDPYKALGGILLIAKAAVSRAEGAK